VAGEGLRQQAAEAAAVHKLQPLPMSTREETVSSVPPNGWTRDVMTKFPIAPDLKTVQPHAAPWVFT